MRTPERILEFLKKGDQNMRFSSSRNAVLVLGLTGTGKSTLTHFIAGNNDNLVSEEKGLGNYIVKDYTGKICGPTIESCTVIPELVVDRSANNTAFYDCPGFSDSRSLAHNIGSSYFIQKIIRRIDSVKIILVIDYDSVRSGGNRLSFLALVKHLYSMIKDVEKFDRSIVLVVTKVENLVTKIRGQYTVVPDGGMIEGIVKLLQESKDFVNKQLGNTLSSDEQKFYQNTARIIDILINVKEPNHPRIGIFRRPDELGPLSQIEIFKKGRAVIRDIVHGQLVFTPCSQDDFRHTISENSVLDLLTLKEEIKKYIQSDISLIGEQLISYYGEQERRSNDMDALYTSLKKSHDALSKIKDEGNPRAFVEEVMRHLNALDVSISWGEVRYILNYCGYLEFIEPMLKRSTDKQVKWTDGIKNVLNYLDESNKWFRILIDLRTTFSDYKIQLGVGRYASIVESLLSDQEGVLMNLKTLLEKMGQGKTYEMPSGTLSGNKARFLKALTKAAFQNITTDCTMHSMEDGKTEYKLVIKGYNVKMSEVSTLKCADDRPFNVVEILALNKVFFDMDYVKRGGVVMIIAPELEVVGKHKLDLDGEHNSVEHPEQAGRNGEMGAPGLPGGSAGEFVLVALECTNCMMLSVSLVGGKGGRGQDGATGAQGADGSYPYIPFSYCTEALVSHCARNLIERFGEPHYLNCIHEPLNAFHAGNITCEVIGSRGQEGGKGGDGGVGGLGGYKGKVSSILDTNHATHLPVITSAQGLPGTGGSGGQGGHGGALRKLTYMLLTYWSFPRSLNLVYEIDQHTNRVEWAANGIEGDNSANQNGILSPPMSVPFNPVYSLNVYKDSLREHSKNPVLYSALRNFLDYLENHEGFNKFYNTKALVNDLMVMEHHFQDSRDENTTAFSYKCLLERILRYAENPQSNEKSDEYKLVLAYLYSTTLSKICRLNESMKRELVVDMKGYLRGVKQHITQLQEFEKTAEREKIKSKYNEAITDKINEATDLIKNEITPAIQSYNQLLIESMGALFDETIALEKQAEVDRSTLLDQKTKLANQLMLAKILGVVQVASQALTLLGPVGAAVGAGIGLGTTVAQNLQLGSVSEDYTVTNLPAAVGKSLDLFKAQFEQTKKKTEQKLEEADRILNDFKDDSKSKLEIQQMLNNTKKELNLNFDKAVTGNAESLEKMFNLPKELGKSLADKKASFNKPADNSHKTTKIIKTISKIQDAMSIPNEIIDVYKKVSNGQSSMDKLNAAIEQTEQKMNSLREYEKKIYSVILPTCQRIKEVFMNTEKASAGKSHTALDVSKWEVQNTSAGIRAQLKEMTEGFKTQSQVMNCVDKVEFGMTTMIQVYDRIQDYYDKAQLADYIADITSNKANIKVQDSELQEDIDKLELEMHKNIVLMEFYKSMSAVRQYVFPYARDYMGDWNLPSQMKVENSSHSISHVVRSVIEVLENLERDSTVIRNRDEHSFSAHKFNSQGSSKPPFYVWKYNRYEDLIKDLLRGKEVMLNADITSGLKENAIKFDRIGVNFKMHCRKLQNDLSQALLGFTVELSHMGNSYYRCGNKVFMMTHRPLRIKHSVSKENDEYNNGNDVYSKIKENGALLSPYTMWKLKLVDGDFSKLLDYVGERIDIELEGRGKYLERTIDDAVCTDDLKQYYEEDGNRISEQDLIDVTAEDDADADGCSTWNSAPSMLQRVKRSIQQGIRYLNPFGLAKWLPAEHPLPDRAVPATSYFPLTLPRNTNFDVSSPNRLLTRDKNDTVVQKVDYNLVDIHGNLLWMDMLIRNVKKNNHQKSRRNRKHPEDGDIAHNLAYNAHVPPDDNQ